MHPKYFAVNNQCQIRSSASFWRVILRTWYISARGNVFSPAQQAKEFLLFMWSERSQGHHHPSHSLSSVLCGPFSVHYLWPRLARSAGACVGPAWTRRGHRNLPRLPCPSETRQSGATGHCHRGVLTARHMPEEGSSPLSFRCKFSLLVPIFRQTEDNALLWKQYEIADSLGRCNYLTSVSSPLISRLPVNPAVNYGDCVVYMEA